MYRFNIAVMAISLSVIFCPVAVGQQGRNIYDFSFIKDSNPWLVSSNAAGLATLQVDRTSFVEAYFNKEDGGLIPVEGSDNSLLAGARTESFARISDMIVFHGMLSYSYFHGKNMSGHYFMDPSYNPINFIENAGDNAGVKVKELYSLSGGMSCMLGEGWALGLQFDYETGDYAKRKDPRPRSRWMDLGMSAGVRFAPSESFSAGLNFLYERTVENLDCSIFGTTDQQYYTFIDYGGYFGTVERLDGDLGFIKTTSPGRPMINSFFGGALQLTFGNPGDILFFNELTYRYRDGHYGDRSSNEAIYCEFGGNTASYNGVLGIRSGNAMHKVSLYGEYAGLINYENIYRRTTNPGGNTVVEYFGQNEIYHSIGFSGKLSYNGYLGIDRFRPKWEYGAELDASYKTFRATYYPFYRNQEITVFSGSIRGGRNFTVTNNIFTVGLDVSCYMGSGTKNEDGTYAESVSDNHSSNDSYLDRDFEYDTAARAGATLSFRYTRLFGDKISAYVDVRDTYNHTLKNPSYLTDGFRNIFVIALGCAF